MHESIKILHATAGLFIGITGLLQAVLPKGGRRHRTIGRLYFWSWPLVLITGAMMGSPLITLFGILGFYMAFTGFRLASKRKICKKFIDKLVIIVCIILALVTLGWGISLIIGGEYFGVVAAVFGVIFSITTISDYLDFIAGKKVRKHSGQKKQWYFEHITRMYVSYIAALTAFTVIQKIFTSTYLNWLLPTVIGTLLIIISQRFFSQKMEKKEVARKS